ncbi:MAG: ribosome biogenesis GTPase YlqF [Oscillospiraceae bacterium]|nr:ribosome biogenesis GTPase YlqF [Oscillospiraceae bacterium]
MAIDNINWYPGHMKKTRELIAENLKLVDLVVEVLDARIPVSSRNPVIGELTGRKPRIIVLNKSDLADAAQNAAWCRALAGEAQQVLTLDSVKGKGISELLKSLEAYQANLNEGRSRKKNLRLMIVGVPNVGKSSLINRLTGKKSARTGDKPGVTRGKQWLTLVSGMQLLDTPGILWPKFEDRQVGIRLAFCGSIRDEILDQETLALELIRYLGRDYPQLLKDRYKLEWIRGAGEGPADAEPEGEAADPADAIYGEAADEDEKDPALLDMEEIARRRGFFLAGKRIDYTRTARTVLDEFRAGKIGRITLEKAVLQK